MTSLLRTDLNDFLFASIADDANGMPLTMLTALARTGADPWAEAAALAALSRETATQKLVSLLAKIPNGPAPGADTLTLASRLVALLHAAARQPAPTVSVAPPVETEAPAEAAAPVDSLPPRTGSSRRAVYYLLALLLIGALWVQSRQNVPTQVDTSLPAAPSPD
jgi:hypothetical protein